jgi:hypothetical protein
VSDWIKDLPTHRMSGDMFSASLHTARQSTHVAILERDDAEGDWRGNHKAVLVPPGQSLDFDDGPGATRKWLYPYLGTEYHLLEFIELVKP